MSRLQERVFLFLVAYRWASLLPGLWLLGAAPVQETLFAPAQWTLAAAGGLALLVTLFNRPLNRLLLRQPFLLGLDMLLAVALLALSGGTRSPYYLYALSPLLAGAFFFQMRGALLSAALFTPLYLGGLFLAQQYLGVRNELDVLSTQLAGIWLIAVLFGYPSVLLQRLRRAHDDLAKARDELTTQHMELGAAHRQLEIIHDLTISLQAAPDVQSVQQRILEVVTQDLGFTQAVIGLVHPITEHVESWRAQPQPAPAPHTTRLPLTAESGVLAQALLHEPGELLSQPRQHWFRLEGALSMIPALNDWIGAGPWLGIPLALREHVVGVLLVANAGGDPAANQERLDMLEPVASQAAVALGTTMMCIDRAQRLAVERERNRIARDIHDTVAQSLFGIVFSLDACIAMLPEQAEAVQSELVELRSLASNVRQQVRQSIFDLWPAELALESFKAGLREHANQCCNARAFKLDFYDQGDFDRLPPEVRRALYQLAQEAVANAARHSGAAGAQVHLAITPGEVNLRVQDSGAGFDPSTVRPGAHGGLGLRGLQQRVEALGGRVEMHSAPGQGAALSVRLPLGEEDWS